MTNVLIVEDLDDLSAYVKAALAFAAPEDSILCAESVADVTDELLDWCDVILLDWRLSDGDGGDVIDLVDLTGKGPRVVVWSAAPEIIDERSRHRVARVLSKPGEIDELVDALHGAR